MNKLIVLSTISFLLTACSGLQPNPAPIEEPKVVIKGKRADGVGGPNASVPSRSYRPTASSSSRSAVVPAKGVQVQAYQQNVSVPLKPTHSGAVTSLLLKVQAHEDAGEFGAAISTLERALDIERKNADLWHRMSSLRVKQTSYPIVIEMAKKSNILAGGNPELRRKNWYLIAKARRFMGNESGALDAEDKALAVF